MVGRTEILEKLELWEAEELSSLEMHAWAVQLHFADDLDFDDWEGDRRFSVAKEALAELEMLDMNMITREDAPVFVDFLRSPHNQFEQAYVAFIAKLQQIDLAERKKALKDIEPYRRHCRTA